MHRRDFQNVLKGRVPVPPGAVPFVRSVAGHFIRAKAGK